MGKPTGFLEIARETPADRSPTARVADWDEMHEHFSEDRLAAQGRIAPAAQKGHTQRNTHKEKELG